MRLYSLFQSSKSFARGSAITECAIAIPLLAIVMASTFELGRVFSQYLALTQIAYEGARAGSQLTLDSTSEGCFSQFVLDDMEVSSNPNFGPRHPHRQVMARVSHLIGLQGDNVTMKCDSSRAGNRCGDTNHAYFASRPTISAEYVPAAGFSGNNCVDVESHASTYAIRVEGMYSGLLLPISFKIGAESRALVLTTNQNFSPTLTDPNGTAPEQAECSEEEIKYGKCAYGTEKCTLEELTADKCSYGSCTAKEIELGLCKSAESKYLEDTGELEKE